MFCALSDGTVSAGTTSRQEMPLGAALISVVSDLDAT